MNFLRNVNTARRAFRLAVPCRDTRGMLYTHSLTGNAVGVGLGVLIVVLFAAIALMGG